MLLLSVGVVVVAFAATIVVVGYAFARPRPLDSRAAAVRVATAAAVLSMGSAVMRFVGDRDINVVSVNYPADTAFVLAAGLMCVAMSMARERHARIAAGVTLLVGLAIATSSVLLPPDVALIVLLCALTLASGACATLAISNRVLPKPPLIVIASATAFFALHCATRLLATLTNGPTASFATVPFGVNILVAALVANAGVAAAILMLFLPVARDNRTSSQAVTALTIQNWNLVTEAYGMTRAQELLTELQAATRHHDPDAAPLRHGVSTTLSAPAQTLTATLTFEYGWQPHEIALITESTEVPDA